LTIRLEVDAVTQKKNVIIKYDSDSDALPSEHEEQHRALVEELIRGGNLSAEDLGQVKILREGESIAAVQKVTPEEVSTPKSESQGE
jgi:hypothetical protein